MLLSLGSSMLTEWQLSSLRLREIHGEDKAAVEEGVQVDS